MSKLTNTIRTEVDEDYFMDIADFRDYARSMMFPDPVGIDMSDELNDMVTEAVNSGKTTLEDSFKKLVKRDAKGRIDYSYSDGFDGFRYGQELLCFCDTETAAQRLGRKSNREGKNVPLLGGLTFNVRKETNE